MTESAEKIAFRNAFNTKLSKREAKYLYLLKSEYEQSINTVNSSIIAEQMVGFYNGCAGTTLDWRDYSNLTADQ